VVDGDSVANKLLAFATGAKALARTETPTENVKTNARNPNFIIIVTILPTTKKDGKCADIDAYIAPAASTEVDEIRIILF
jgi:hypothetical protein